MLYNVSLVSAVQQSESTLCVHTAPPFRASLCCCCSLSHLQIFVIPWAAAHQTSLSFSVFWSLLKLMFIKLVVLSNHLTLRHPLLHLPSIFPSIRVFYNESVLCIRWPNIGVSASASVLPMNILVSFRMDWLDLLAVQRTLKSLLQHHSSEASVLRPQPSSQHGTR